jgi:hypothetical protein
MRMVFSSLAVLMAMSHPAVAQDIVMRRAMTSAGMEAGQAPVQPAPAAPAGTWSSTAWTTPGLACGLMHQVRTSVCTGGVCSEQDRPVEEQDIGGPQCVLAWVPAQQGAWSSTCSDAATRTTSYGCTAYPPGSPGAVQPASDDVCVSGGLPKPDATERTGVYSGCTHQWSTGEWSEVCGPTAISTRAVTCQRSGAGGPATTVDDAFCDAASRPAMSDDSSKADSYRVCIPDAGFEDGGAGWSASQDATSTSIAHGGTKGLLLSGYSSLKQVSFPSVPGETLTASVWHRNAYLAAPTAQTGPFIALGPSSGMFSGSYNFSNASPSWINMSMTWKPTTTTTYLSLSIVNSSSPDNKVAMDDVVVIARRR